MTQADSARVPPARIELAHVRKPAETLFAWVAERGSPVVARGDFHHHLVAATRHEAEAEASAAVAPTPRAGDRPPFA